MLSMQRLRRRLWRQDVCVKTLVSPTSNSSTQGSWDNLESLQGFDFNLESMEEELTCPVCLELYADPLMLPCSHSVCKKCLQDILDSRTKKKKTKKDLVLDCPSCRKEVHLNKEKLEGLPRNLALENVVIKFTEEKSKSIRKSLSIESPVADKLFGSISSDMELPEFPSTSQVSCEMCEGSNPSSAMWYCVQCEVSYCHFCFGKYHPRRGALARHKIRHTDDEDGSEKEQQCKEHESEIAALFCDKCKILVCHLCLCEGEGKHAGHTVLAPETACKKIKESFDRTKEESDSLLASMLEQKGKIEALTIEIEELHQDAMSRIDMQYLRLQKDIITALAMEKHRALQSLEQAKSSFVNKTKSFIDENQLLLSELENLSHKCHKATDDKRAKEILRKAKDVSPLLTLLEKYQKQVECVTDKYYNSVKDKSSKTALQTGATQFGNDALNMYACYFKNDPPEASVPLILSQVPGGKYDLTPRVQNKCLTTWGFSSTTFTAERQTQNCSWTITVEKNMSQIGAMNTGYLFGIGISSQNLNVKHLAGMTENSYALLCSMGQLQFGHNGQMEDITALESLPLTIAITLNLDHRDYIIFTYRIELCTEGQVTSLIGKKLIKDEVLKNSLYPVFTVSQRVKLLFPTCV